MKDLRDYLIKRVLEEIPDSGLNGHPEKRLCNNANFTFKFIEGEKIKILFYTKFGNTIRRNRMSQISLWGWDNICLTINCSAS